MILSVKCLKMLVLVEISDNVDIERSIVSLRLVTSVSIRASI